MVTPFDWQEGMGHRQQYVRGRLESASPVFMVSLPEGILGFAMRRQARKIYEIYDRLMFGASGQQSDIEAIRTAAIDFAHQEGYNRSEDDVTIARVVGAISTPLKRAFSDFNTAPFVIQGVFAEVGDTPEEDSFYFLDFDGDFSVHRNKGYVLPDEAARARVAERLANFDHTMDAKKAMAELKQMWALAMSADGVDFTTLSENLCVDAAILRRERTTETSYVALSE